MILRLISMKVIQMSYQRGRLNYNCQVENQAKRIQDNIVETTKEINI